MARILLLEDNVRFLAELADTLTSWGHEALSATTPKMASMRMEPVPDFAIVDLFLAGDEGDHLSNEFIRDVLSPAGVGYGRLTSAPKLVPEDYQGDWVLHKYHYLDDPGKLRDLLIESLACRGL